MEPSPTLTVGQRIRFYREHAGKSRAVVGGLVGRSPAWVKAVENGRLLPPRLPMLDQLARILGVSVGHLMGDPSLPPDPVATPGHPALPAVRDAINRYPIRSAAAPPDLASLGERIAAAWRARHGAPDHRTVLGGLLPDLIRDTQLAVRGYDGPQRRQAQVLLADLFGLAQMFIAYQPDAALLWRVTDRAVVAAHESGDVAAIAGAVWFAMEAYRDAGDWDTAMAINLDVLGVVEPRLPTGDTDLLALYGALQTGAAFTAARMGQEGRAWRHFDQADRVSRRLPAGYAQPWTWFSAPVVGFYAVSVCVELQKGGEALRAARRIPPETITSRPRRARHLIEVARAHNLRAEHADTLAALRLAYETAPETIRFNSYARKMTLDLLSGPAEIRRDARDLAMKVGLLTAP
jgi:transcriptional regulator with XRE-family HTH domain